MTVHEAAEKALEWFTTARRSGGGTFVTLREDHPPWVQELCHRAHGDMLPDDWRYQAIMDAVEYISRSAGTLDDSVNEFADSMVDVYDVDRVNWLDSNHSRGEYCNEAMRELGVSTDDPSIYAIIGMGQYQELTEVYTLVFEFLEEYVEGRDDAGEDEEQEDEDEQE